MKQLTIGLAGHIDHGKTSIVKFLTGKNTDNLKEEIKRGMTIDIGFAHLNKKISLIDVPGHEKFIKNMVSGVSSIDFAILVIAANDGIMPQTIEHFEILRLLDVKSGIIVINKIDLVDSDLLELVELEIIDFTKDTFLSNAKIFKTSTLSGEGMGELKNELIQLDELSTSKFKRNIFGMFIDRVFTIKGFGTVVTGTVSSGSAKVGNILEVQPFTKQVKIRGLHSHDENVNEIESGNRAAINLQLKDKINIKRGCHISTKDYFCTSSTIAVKVKLLSKSKIKIKHNQRIRFHLGTQEVMGRILLASKDINLEFPAIIKFEKAIVASFNDKFILRSYSPILTVGGGNILDVNVVGRWNKIKKYVQELSDSKDISEIIRSIVGNSLPNIYDIDSLSIKLSLHKTVLKKYLTKLNDIIYFGKNNKWLITKKQFQEIKKMLLHNFEILHKKNPDKSGFNKKEINDYFKFDIDFLELILTEFCNNKNIKMNNNLYSLYNYRIQISEEDNKIKKRIINILDKQGINTYSIDELSENLEVSKNIIIRLIKIESNNNLIILNDNIFISRNNYEKILHKVKDFFKRNHSMNIKQFKDLFNTTRKYAVPLLEYLDKKKITYRIGNERKIT